MQNTQYFDLPERIEGTVEPVPPHLISASDTDKAYHANLIREYAKCIGPRTNIPMGYSLYFLIMHTDRCELGGSLTTDALYKAFRNYVPAADRIPNIGSEQFEGHLERWVKANSFLYAPSDTRMQSGVSHVAGLAFRDKPLSDEAVRAYAKGMAFGR